MEDAVARSGFQVSTQEAAMTDRECCHTCVWGSFDWHARDYVLWGMSAIDDACYEAREYGD